MVDDASERARGVANRGIERNAKLGAVQTIKPGKIYNVVGFDVGKSNLKKKGFEKDLDKKLGPVVDRIRRERKEYEAGTRTTHPTVTVTGHASDSVKPGKGPQYYASERAKAVKDYLVKHDVPPDWIQTTTSRETPNPHPNMHATPDQKTAARSATIDVGASEDPVRAILHRSLDNRYADYPEIGPAPPEAKSRAKGKFFNQLARREFVEGYLPYPSFELRGRSPNTDSPRNSVWFWIADHARTIKRVAAQRNVDARAIAGAIAWEGLQNPYPVELNWLGKDQIVGKIHIPENEMDRRRYGQNGQADFFWAVAVEGNYMPHCRADERRTLLEGNDEIAIQYIGAIMALIADEAKEHDIDIRRNPGALTWAYHGRHPDQWRAWLWDKLKDSSHTLTMRLPTDAMGWWVHQNLPYLESALK
ncbi:hypothetical protein BN2475_1840001 [Paraburkholderia ribeironis]|uniref:OmpA-like domain-containing protein n=1 Tax=Paraburkholderia ribeironis TaxID=1247936 RepID=A0A1N7SR52_9BURK|nr:OmpA family protein [Paraburkholderia ribeironis]SIT49799.1 hypothetical protein BN2475_1840001 [Paraburkholderia ribeironis]